MKKIKYFLLGLAGLLPVVAGAQTEVPLSPSVFQIIIAYLPLLLILAIIISIVLIILTLSKMMQKGKMRIALLVLMWFLIAALALEIIGTILTVLGY